MGNDNPKLGSIPYKSLITRGVLNTVPSFNHGRLLGEPFLGDVFERWSLGKVEGAHMESAEKRSAFLRIRRGPLVHLVDVDLHVQRVAVDAVHGVNVGHEPGLLFLVRALVAFFNLVQGQRVWGIYA